MPVRFQQVAVAAVITDARQREETMSSQVERKDEKQMYEPPQLVAISLRPEEAVLGHCKTPSIAGPVQATCTAIAPCGSVGS